MTVFCIYGGRNLKHWLHSWLDPRLDVLGTQAQATETARNSWLSVKSSSSSASWAKGQSNWKTSVAMQQQIQSQCLSQTGSSYLVHLIIKNNQSEIFISEMLARSSPLVKITQYLLYFFIEGYWQADTFCTGFIFYMISHSVPKSAHYNNLALEWNVGEIIYCKYSHTYVLLKIIWCLLIIVAGTINKLATYYLSLLWRL